MKSEEIYLRHIIESIEIIEEFSNSPNAKELFMRASLLQDGVLRRLHTLAESTKHLSEGVKSKMEGIPWQDIADFRNVLVHGYLGDINLDIVWNTIKNDLPELKEAILNFINNDFINNEIS